MRGYDIVSSPRANNKRGGGVAFLCKDFYRFKEVKTNKYLFFELLEVLFICKNTSIRFSTIYRTGILNVKERSIFLEELCDYLDSLVFKEGLNILWGDFNISKEQSVNKTFYSNFIDLLESKGYKLIIDKPTHDKNGILDLIFVPFNSDIGNAVIFGPDSGVEISDHFPIKIEIPLEPEKVSKFKHIKYRDFKNVDLNLLKMNLALSFSCNLFNNMDMIARTNLESATKFLIDTLTQNIDVHAPIIDKKIKITKHVVNNLEIRDARRQKRKAERKFKKTKDEKDKEKLRNAKKDLNRIITQHRDQYFQEKFQISKGNLRHTYKLVNQLLDKSNKSIFPNHSEEKDLADKFADFYLNKIECIRNNFKNLNTDCLKLPVSVVNNLEKFEIVSAKEISDIIKSLVNKQCVLDVMPCSFFKNLIPQLVPALYKLINSSLMYGMFPSVLKTSVVTPVIKSKKLDIDILNNYRPVSNMSILSKIFEKCVLKQLVSHLDHNNLNAAHQSAYRPHHSCETAIMKILDDVLTKFNSESFIVMTFLDFSAAFDTVDHTILINKLEQQFGVTGNALLWFKSYLDSRSYKIKINNTLSKLQYLSYGVPQGSILGPVLYSLYITEIESITKFYNINIHIYADDILLYTDYKYISNLKLCLLEIHRWASNNYLKLNNNKTQLICLSPKRNTISKPSVINLMGEDIPVENSARYLGIWLDENLCMSKQVNNVCGQGYAMLRNLWKISSKISDTKLRIQLIHSCVLSKLNFCSAIYNSLPKKELNKLDKLLKASARFIFRIIGIRRREHMTPYLQQLHFLPINYRSEYKINLFVYKSFIGQAPNYITNLLLPHINYSQRITRKENDKTWLDRYPIEKINYKCRSFRHIAPNSWNRLDINIRESPSIDIFKSRLKTFYFQEWLTL